MKGPVQSSEASAARRKPKRRPGKRDLQKPQNFGNEGHRLSIRCPALVGCNRLSPLKRCSGAGDRPKPMDQSPMPPFTVQQFGLHYATEYSFSTPARRVWLFPSVGTTANPSYKIQNPPDTVALDPCLCSLSGLRTTTHG